MLVSVISPQRRAAGATSVAALVGQGLSEQNRSVILMNSAAHSNSFNMYFGINKNGAGDTPASQLLNLVKMGGATKDSVPNYCCSVNSRYDVFSIEDENKDKDSINEVHKYLLEGAPYDYIVCDIDTDLSDPRTKDMLDRSDCIVLVLDSGIKNLSKFADVRKDFASMTRYKPVITVLNDYDDEVLKKEDAADIAGITNKKAVALWNVIHYCKYIPYCENRGELQLLFEQMSKRTSQAIMLDSEVQTLTKQIIKIQTQLSKARIQSKGRAATGE